MLTRFNATGKTNHACSDDRAALANLVRLLNDREKPSPGLFDTCYIDDEWYKLEQDALFEKKWTIAAFSHEISDKGTVKPVVLFDRPIVLVRDLEGKLQVFENICKHRGAILVEEPRRLKSNLLTCPYHAWCYDLQGKLRKTPHIGGANCNHDLRFDLENVQLTSIRHYEWMGMIFVNLSGTATDFADHYSDLIKRWEVFGDKKLYHCGEDSTILFELNCNWKLAVENYCESYHLPMVHPSLNEYSKLEDHYDILSKNLYSGQGTTVYNPNLLSNGLAFADAASLPARWKKRGEYIALYPNVLLGIHRDHFYVIWLEPLGVDKVRERVEIFYFDPSICEDHMGELRRANKELWRSVFSEDIGPVESMQKGRRGMYLNGGTLTPAMEMSTRCFLSWVANETANSLKIKR